MTFANLFTFLGPLEVCLGGNGATFLFLGLKTGIAIPWNAGTLRAQNDADCKLGPPTAHLIVPIPGLGVAPTYLAFWDPWGCGEGLTEPLFGFSAQTPGLRHAGMRAHGRFGDFGGTTPCSKTGPGT
jgi:hypothetical protein